MHERLEILNFKKYYFFAAIFFLLTISIHITQSYFSLKSALMKHINTELLQSAKTAPLILPANFHHRGMLQEKISPQLDRRNLEHLSKLAKAMGIKYIYTMVKEGNKIIFTSSSATDQELVHNKNLTYFGDVYDEASPVLFQVFKSRLTATDDGTDQWGAYHSVYVPMLSSDGTLYVVGADVNPPYLDKKLLEILLNSLFGSLVYILLLIPFLFIYRKEIRNNAQKLENIILKRTKELQQQKYALDAHAIVVITDVNGTITFVNKKFEKISGYSRNKLIGKNIRMLNSGLHDSEFWKEMYHTVSNGNFWHADVRNKAKDGSYYWVNSTIVPFLNAEGNTESYISIQTDITALKNSEMIITRKEELLQTLLNSVTEGIFGVDTLGNCTFVNKSFLRILGYDNEDKIIGKHIHGIIHHSHKNGTHYPSSECKIYNIHSANQSAHSDKEVFWKQNGECIDVEYWSYPMLRDGHCIGAVATFMDITEQNKHKKKLKERELQMIQQSRFAQMGEMLSMIAHQWRQPLSAIVSTAITMRLKIDFESFDLDTSEGRKAQSDFYIEKLGNIQSYVDSLSSIIDDFRNFYRPDKKTVPVSFHAVADKALAIIRDSIEADKIELIEEYGTENQFEMHDNEMLQVILNILKNAQDNFKEKAIQNPQIRIVTHNCSLLICDNGGGIAPDILEKIFDPYFSTKDELNGTGLGLHMSKTIIEDHHQGKLMAYNQNEGVCFEINLENTNA